MSLVRTCLVACAHKTNNNTAAAVAAVVAAAAHARQWAVHKILLFAVSRGEEHLLVKPAVVLSIFGLVWSGAPARARTEFRIPSATGKAH